MNKYKVFTTFIALALLALPAVSFADGKFYYGNVNVIESQPVLSTGYNLDQNTNTVVAGSGSTQNTVYTGSNTDSYTMENILGINIKSKAERDAEKLAKANAEALAAENARVARQNDGTFAYGYTDGTGAQYVNGARYVDARSTKNTMYTASSGFLPNTVGGWVIALLLVATLVYIARKLKEMEAEKLRKLENKKQAFA